jgi:hypothetical protein
VSPIGVRGAERSSLEPKIFRQCRNTALQKNHSPFATHHLLSTAHHPLPFYQSLIASRHSLPFWLGRSLAFPIHSIPRPASHDPFRFCPLSRSNGDKLVQRRR